MPFAFRRSKPAHAAPVRDADFFKCAVDPTNGKATIQLGRRRMPAIVQEKGIDGMTLLIKKPASRRLKLGRSWVLDHHGEQSEVFPQWVYQTPEGDAQVAVRRLRDLKPDPMVTGQWWSVFFNGQSSTDIPVLGFGVIVMALFCVLALPGIGDDLGTSDRIEASAQWVISEARAAMGR